MTGRRIVQLVLLVVGFASATSAQYVPPTGGFDTYHGLTNTSCTNTNTAFASVKVGNRLVLCDPAGHIFFLKSFFTFDLNAVVGNDEFSHTYPFYANAKYGTSQKWADQSIARFLTWGFTGLAVGRNTSLTNPWTTANPVPFLAGSDIAHYATYNPQNYSSSCFPKDLMSILVSGNTFWAGFTKSTASITDFNDSCWGTYYAAFLNADAAFAVGGQPVAMKHYLIAIADCDADNCHGFGAGPDFPPANGNYDFRLGYMNLFLPPTKFSDSGDNKVYPDGTVYAKKVFHDLTLAAHGGTIGGVNSADGSSYTTDLTSGTCFGVNQPAWLCPSPSAAVSLGTGDGSTTTFTGTLTTTVAKYSVYISKAGTNAAGDNGGGTIFGTGVTGTINYATGAISVTFTTAPTTGQAIAAGSIANGWGIGTGMMDEDCRVSHQGYCGNGGTNATEFLTGVNAGMAADVNALTKQTATNYATGAENAIDTWRIAKGFTGKVLHAGIYALGSWGASPDKYILQGLAGHQDIIIAAGSGAGFSQWSQGMIDSVGTNWGDVPIIGASYRTSNRDSSFAWQNSSCVHSGATVTCTVGTPSIFTTGDLIDTFCTDTTYNRLQIHPNGGTVSGTVIYTASGTPTNASTTCTVAYSDNNNGGFTSQPARGTDYKNGLVTAIGTKFTGTGTFMYVGVIQWAWQDYYNGEKLNWGIVTNKDNPYNGIDDNGPSTFTCQAPDALFTCGGEGASHINGGPMGDYISPVGLGHVAVDNVLLGTGGSGAVSLSPVSPPGTLFVPQLIGVTSPSQTITLTNTGTATLNITTVALTGANSADFAITANTCGLTLAQLATCTVTLTFTPSALAQRSAFLTFTTDAITSPDNSTLTGNGIQINLPIPSPIAAVLPKDTNLVDTQVLREVQ